MNRRTLVRMIGGAAAVPVLTGCTLLDPLDDNRVEVEITGNRTLSPGGITIKVGDTIVWRNMDSVPHVLSSDPADFDDVPVQNPEGAQPFSSDELVSNDRFTHQFDVPGDYIYASATYPEVIGTITVESSESE